MNAGNGETNDNANFHFCNGKKENLDTLRVTILEKVRTLYKIR
ncbi:MAG: hypothetical protein WDO19_17310 [Bacteroidota bacterium]